jgi:hypothetical protein
VPGGLERLTGVDAFAHHVRRYQEIYDDLRFAIRSFIQNPFPGAPPENPSIR